MRTDFDVFIVPDFKLDTNFNYEIKLVLNSRTDNSLVINQLIELGFVEYKELNLNTYTKLVYYTSLSCFTDLRKWLLQLAEIFNELSIRSNLDNTLINKTKELKK